MDEFGVNFDTGRRYGYSLLGTQAVQTIQNTYPDNMSVILAVSKRGLVFFQIVIGTVNAQIFSNFLSAMVPLIQGYNNPCIILDNASVYSQAFLQFSRQTSIQLRRLPPYSPMLTPIEEVINSIKLKIKTDIDVTYAQYHLAIQNGPNGMKKV